MLKIMCSLATALCLLAPAHAEFPERPVKVIVPTPPGVTDGQMRVVMPAMQKALGQPLVLDYRPGAAATIGVTAAKSAAADGYTLLFTGTGSLTIQSIIHPDQFTINDFVLVGVLSNTALVLASGPHVPYQNLTEMVAYARANPGRINYASNGVGSSNHLAAQVTERAMGIKLALIPFGSMPALQGVMNGSADISFALPQAVVGMAKAGKLRVLAVAGSRRSEFFPESPTLKELGTDQAEETKLALFAPKGVPADVLAKLRNALQAAMQDKAVQASLRAAGVSPFIGTPEDGVAVLQEENERWRKVLAVPEIRNSLTTAR